MQYRGRYPTDPEYVLPNRYRDFETVDKTTLEQLAAMILQILCWADDHLYEFRIKGRSYVNFGDNADYIPQYIRLRRSILPRHAFFPTAARTSFNIHGCYPGGKPAPLARDNP